MSERKIKGSQWWVGILAFLAGFAVHAGASAHRSQTLMAAPEAAVATPVANSEGRAADASSDTCSVQQD
jgi:hypothetical protein